MQGKKYISIRALRLPASVILYYDRANVFQCIEIGYIRSFLEAGISHLKVAEAVSAVFDWYFD